MPTAEAKRPTICGGRVASAKNASQMVQTARPASAESSAPWVVARFQ